MTNNPSDNPPQHETHGAVIPSGVEGSPSSQEHELGRNEPCPCGSKKKYKRCHGVAAAPKLSMPKVQEGFAGAEAGANGMPQMPPGMEHMTPEMMGQVASMLQRLPKGQLQRLQTVMQKAMSGKDVTREAEEFQKTLPAEFQQMLMSMAPGMAAAQGQGGLPATFGGADSTLDGGMSEEEARRIVAEAAASGKISADKAADLLVEDGKSEGEEKTGVGKFWRNLTKK
jgi:hypothetical protein